MRTIPLDAIPDLSDTQVIVYSRWDRSPDIMEDQVTYPIVTAMLGAPKRESRPRLLRFRLLVRLHHFRGGHGHLLGALRVRSSICRACCRACRRACKTELGPTRPASAGCFSTRSSTTTGKHELGGAAQLQDWYLRYQLQSVPGRGGGGAARRLRAAVPGQRRSEPAAGATTFRSRKVVEAVRAGNNDVGGRLRRVQRRRVHGARPRLCASPIDDIGDIVLSATDDRRSRSRAATSARSTLGPDMRRGVADWTGTGDVVSGIVVMRQGENALDVIDA